jgi:hypothetical protein
MLTKFLSSHHISQPTHIAHGFVDSCQVGDRGALSPIFTVGAFAEVRQFPI